MVHARTFVHHILVVSALAAIWALSGPAWAGDWPQILGPHRNGIAESEKLADSWPKTGPPTVWQRPVGSGLAGVAVSDDTLILFHRLENREVVEALNPATGTPLWKQDFPARYVPTFIDDDGPRCVPLIHEANVYVLGALGGLHCLDLKTGDTRWSRDLYEDYLANDRTLRGGEPKEGYFGIGSTPIVEGDKLILNIGGVGQGAGIAAVSLETGKTLWTATNDRASYSAPVAVTVDGIRHVIFVTRLNLVSVDPESGNIRFQIPFGRTGPTVNAASPVIVDGNVFVTASYNIGALYARISKAEAQTIWRDEQIMASQYTTCVAHEGFLYGIDGRQDIGVAALRCIEPGQQKVRWTQPNFGTATLILADGKLLILKSDGELIMAEPNPDRYRELAKSRILGTGPSPRRGDNAARALPALSNGYFYARDGAVLKCINLRPRE